MLDNTEHFNSGLCNYTRILYELDILDFWQYSKMKKYLRDNKPKKQYYNCGAYWWPAGLKEPRIEWLQEQIAICDKESIWIKIKRIFKSKTN
jgi:hypothetical protein